jgi:hypothetical protein
MDSDDDFDARLEAESEWAAASASLQLEWELAAEHSARSDIGGGCSWPEPSAGSCTPPRPERRAQLSTETPSTSASSSSSPLGLAAAGAGEAGAVEPRRKRLRAKTPPADAGGLAAAASPAPVLPSLEDSKAGDPEGILVWSDGVEDRWLAMTERQRYVSFRKRFQRWLVAQLALMGPAARQGPMGESLLACVTTWATASWEQKGAVSRMFLRTSKAPVVVVDWAPTGWPALSRGPVLRDGRGLARGWFYGRQVLLTYQGRWGELSDEPSAAGMPEVLPLLREREVVTDLWAEVRALAAELSDRHHIGEWAVSMELCPDTWESSRKIRVHFHLFLKAQAKFFLGAAQSAAFRAGAPFKSQAAGPLSTRATSGYAGMYYCLAPKVGVLFSEGSHAPFKGFPVNPDWIFSMLAAEKMTLDDARSELVRAGKGLVRRLGDLERLRRCREELVLEQRLLEYNQRIVSGNRAFRHFPVIAEWFAVARAPFQRRKKFLVLEGPSGMGKTEFARHLAGAEATLELNCANCGNHPDLRRHDALKHLVVFCDEAPPRMVAANRKLFQAPATMLDLGHSPTGRDVYRVFLGDSCIVVSSNSWTAEAAELPEEARAWLQANSVLVKVDAPMFEAE